MKAEQRVDLLEKLGKDMLSNNESWVSIKEKAINENSWFISQFVDYQLHHIATEFLNRKKLEDWISRYNVPGNNSSPKNVGIVMAGNIPLAGFHDFLATFISGNKQTIKPSSKDFQLIHSIVEKMKEWNSDVGQLVSISEL